MSIKIGQSFAFKKNICVKMNIIIYKQEYKLASPAINFVILLLYREVIEGMKALKKK